MQEQNNEQLISELLIKIRWYMGKDAYYEFEDDPEVKGLLQNLIKGVTNITYGRPIQKRV